MAAPSRTHVDPEAIFAEFVKNANAITQAEHTPHSTWKRPTTDPSSEDTLERPPPEPHSAGGGAVMLLTKKKSEPPKRSTDPESGPSIRLHANTTARLVAELVVPDVRHVPAPAAPVAERSDNGHMPAGELDRFLSDMAVLFRWGHVAQVEYEIDLLLERYGSDLLLLRRVTEFYVETEQRESAVDALFRLTHQLFERRNLAGMKAALEQILALDGSNERARRLGALLDKRAPTSS